jgi:hypothetical protein
MQTLEMGSDYRPGYEKVPAAEREIAANFCAHTRIGDQQCEAVIEELFDLGDSNAYRLMKAAMDEDDKGLSDAPQSLLDFFEDISNPPAWWDPSATGPGIRSFHRHSDMILQAFAAGVLVEGFTTNIARSFIITGRLRDQGVRRLKNNNRHVMEIFWPEGLERQGDGWKLSVRIRLVHAQVRRLLRKAPDWDAEAWGDPISAAHLAFAGSAFSARLLKHSRRIGVPFSKEESDSFMMIWLYSAYLMGIPETILPRSEAEALKLYEVARICEPYPDFESVIMANALVSSVPLLLGLSLHGEGEELRKLAYTVARAFIGDELADQLKFPPAKTRGIIRQMWLNTKLRRFMRGLVAGQSRADRFNNFKSMVEVSVYDDSISYRLPDHVYSEQSERW